MRIYEIVEKLTGEINPVGETAEDSKRFENIKEYALLINHLIWEMEKVAKNCDRYEYSIQRAGKYAENFLKELHEELKMFSNT